MRKNGNQLWIAGGAFAALLAALYVAQHPMDFRVYYFGAWGVFDGTRPVYGRASGLGWPMHYRYPPLFLLLFAPWTLLPLAWGAALWVLLKILALVTVVRAILKAQPATVNFNLHSFAIPVLFVTPYLIEELRYGNVQFFVFALTAMALLQAKERPALAAASLALGISIKVWPLFFVPYMAVRRYWRAAGYTMGFLCVLAMLPGFYFGFGGNFGLLGQWFSQETETQLSDVEIWFPSQSLRGVLMRYLTVIDYSQVPDSNYPKANIFAFDGSIVRALWFVMATAAYSFFLLLVERRRNISEPLQAGLGFCLIALLEPFTQKYVLAILLWPVIVVAKLGPKAPYRTLLYLATILVLIQPVTPGAEAQRFLQVLGLDFAAAALLTIVIAAACFKSIET